MREHDLKCEPEPFAALRSGAKRHETRHNDRGYQVGDVLVLREWVPAGVIAPSRYTGEVERRVVTYVTPGGTWGLPKQLCVMSLQIEHPLATAADALRWVTVRTALRSPFTDTGALWDGVRAALCSSDVDAALDALVDALTKRGLRT